MRTLGRVPTHAWLSRVWARLSPKDKALAQAFLDANVGLSKGDFELKINRMFLDSPEKPKRWKEIMEILSCINS